MAQVDSGMGWNAKEGWIIQTAGTVASIRTASGGSMFPGQPLPILENPGVTDVINNGVHFLKENYRGNIYDYYIAASDSAFLYLRQDSTNYHMGVISANRTTTFYLASTRNGTNPQFYTYTTSTQVPSSLLYYNDIGNYLASESTPDSFVPVFSGTNAATVATTAASYITIAETPISKSENGFAVACLVRWKTPNGTVLESPILISTESDYTTMTTTLAGASIAKLNMLYEGRQFYMAFYDFPNTGNMTTTLPVIDRSYSDAPSFTLEQLFAHFVI